MPSPTHPLPFGQAVLHVGGRLQDGDVEVRAEQHLLDPHLVPVVRHRLDLRVQHRMIDEARHAWAGSPPSIMALPKAISCGLTFGQM